MCVCVGVIEPVGAAQRVINRLIIYRLLTEVSIEVEDNRGRLTVNGEEANSVAEVYYSGQRRQTSYRDFMKIPFK